MAYVLIVSLLVVAILAALAFRAAAARQAQAEDEARDTARKDITDTLLSQTAMVADHVTLKVKEGTTEAQLAAYAQAQGGSILRKLRVPGAGTYLVQFDKVTVDTVPQAVAALGQPAAPVQYVNPDYVAYADANIPNDPRFSELWGMHNIGQAVGSSLGSGTVQAGANTIDGIPIAFEIRVLADVRQHLSVRRRRRRSNDDVRPGGYFSGDVQNKRAIFPSRVFVRGQHCEDE
jgi:hypothetical protein